MRDVYERDQVFYNPYNKHLWRGRDMLFDQDRHDQSEIMSIHKQRHEHPDIYQSNQLNARAQAKFRVPSRTIINMSSKF